MENKNRILDVCPTYCPTLVAYSLITLVQIGVLLPFGTLPTSILRLAQNSSVDYYQNHPYGPFSAIGYPEWPKCVDGAVRGLY
jgi:hypothetical protein